ncbi:hypothetical protein CJD36_019965 [Flavipsychrobacter stenotrophus]|uniref:Uncharacterized protein n=1 Tax=Flavipsychrobacter stenotrophus TaxID=2077091 RepID=A0A2S7SSD6_9BACT|nr:hypothetical protein [Flavipsychrobacter stenotrophus]PQJ09517.1 hypothetical protein CJD36_019965 [Flavipsychrobacter stenotrophus]
MHKYVLISKKFEGYLMYEYDQDGFLIEFKNCAYKMPQDQRESVLKSLRNALTHESFNAWVKAEGRTTIKIDDDLSFDRFWLIFDHARNKLIADKLWKAKAAYDKRYVHANMFSYQWYCKQSPWYNQQYPDTYLRGHFRDEWFKVYLKEKKDKEEKFSK